MQAPRCADVGALQTRNGPPVLAGAVVLVLSALFLGFDIGLRPIVLWDESRVVSNAMEMSRTGFSLVTTYGFKPDLWNTKPPLAIWLIAGCIRLFGPSEWAARLPSLVAAIGTAALVMRFGWRLTRSRFVTLAAPVILVLSPGFYGYHAAQSADYDTLLGFFVTAYLLLLFEVIHQRRPKAWRVLLCALLVAAACLTKGVAGVIPGVGVAIYALASGRWRRLFRSPWYVLGAVGAVGLVAAFYLMRERAAPGYLHAVMVSELTGRYLHGLRSHVHSPLFYPVTIFMLFSFGPGLLAILAAPLLSWPDTRAKAFLVYGGYVGVAMILVFSLSKTTVFWYMVPLYPILSLMLAIVIHRLDRYLVEQWPGGRRWSHALATLVVVVMVALAIYNKRVLLPRVEDTPQGRYGQVFAQLDNAGVRHVRAVDDGVANDDDLVDYRPQLHIYAMAWRSRGMDVTAIGPDGIRRLGPGEVAVTCDPRYLLAVRALGAPLTTVRDCAAAGPRPG